MKSFYTTLLLGFCLSANAQLITEIMYNPPESGMDSLEYIEIYNNTGDLLPLEGYHMIGVEHTFGFLTLFADQRIVLVGNEVAFLNIDFSIPFQWDGGALSNGGEEVAILAPDSTVIHSVTYENSGEWSGLANGNGYALEMCDVTAADPSVPSNWGVSQVQMNIAQTNGITIFGTPGEVNDPDCSPIMTSNATIGEITEIDGDGVLTRLGETVTTQGVVYGINYRPGGLQFTLIDENNDGIGVFLFDADLGYTVVESDEITITGALEQFRGFAQIVPTEIVVDGTLNILFPATNTTTLGEDTESQLVRFQNATLVDPAQWTNDGGGFNVDVTNGTETITMRIDADTDIFGMGYPQGTFDVSGIGGQFDSDAPFLEGYQFLPRYAADISPYDPFNGGGGGVDDFPDRTIVEVTNVDANGVADSIGVACTLTGIVYGINLSANDLIMTVIDDDNNGIGVFNGGNSVGYEVQQGDMVSIEGTISQFNGLTQINPESIEMLSTGNDLIDPDFADILSEDTESSLITLPGVTIDVSQWVGDGSSFNVDATDGVNDFTIRIDNDTELANITAPAELIQVTGIGGQFDSSDPFTDGYQILPRDLDDIAILDAVIDLDFDAGISIHPNPVNDELNILSKVNIEQVKIVNFAGGLMLNQNFNNQSIDVSELPSGSYFIQFISEDKLSTKKFMKL